MNKQMKKWRVGRSAMGMLALTVSVGVGVVGLSATASSAATSKGRVAASANHVVRGGHTHSWKNKLNNNILGWCPAVTPPNSPCDGLSGDYGTIGIYSHTRTDASWGGYAAGVTLSRQSKYARITGGQDGGVPSATGCTVQGDEDCSGPFVLWGPKNEGKDVVFPANGFTTTVEVYLDATWGDANPGNVVDWDTGLQTNTAAYEDDLVIDLCSSATGWEVSWENGSGSCGASPGTPNPEYLTTSGWYTLKMDFTSIGGDVNVAYSVLSNGSTVWSYSQNTGIATSSSGGPLYGWLPTEDVSGLPLADLHLSLN